MCGAFFGILVTKSVRSKFYRSEQDEIQGAAICFSVESPILFENTVLLVPIPIIEIPGRNISMPQVKTAEMDKLA